MCRHECRCVSQILMLTAFMFFTIAFCTQHWSASEDWEIYSGIFKTCLTASDNCFHINVFFNLESGKFKIYF